MGIPNTECSQENQRATALLEEQKGMAMPSFSFFLPLPPLCPLLTFSSLPSLLLLYYKHSHALSWITSNHTESWSEHKNGSHVLRMTDKGNKILDPDELGLLKTEINHIEFKSLLFCLVSNCYFVMWN